MALPNVDPARAARVRERLPAESLRGWSAASAFLDAVFAASPYLGRLAVKRPETLLRLAQDAPEAVVADACARARAAGALEEESELMAALRRAKADLHLSLALADLSGAFTLGAAVAAMTQFADAACAAAFQAAARAAGLDPQNTGAFVLALGKHGAGTLNYSSDIDPVILFEPDAAPDTGRDPRRVYLKLAQALVKYLQEPTGEGYVFRVDLRLRPDPGSTPPAVNADAARRYFESRGQTWERAAYAKARPCAGDAALAASFIEDLRPFIWRRTLDFAAVEDVRALARQIQAIGDRAEIVSAGHDLKLGRGGVREIEFYAQVVQLVFGGRRPELRVAETRAALRALAEADLAPAEDVAALVPAYEFLRRVEHRIQMREDEQSQTLPRDAGARRAVAALCGVGDLDAFDAEVTAVLSRVHGVFSAQFEGEESLASREGSLVLTGVEPTPDTLETLQRLGFSDPGEVWRRLSAWAAGRVRALRTQRAQRLFSGIAPRLVEGLAATGDPDGAFQRFALFLEGLPAGVQVLALLANEPELARELTALIGCAPRLARALARKPALLDVMLQPEFTRPLREDAGDWMLARLAAREGASFEDALNAARRGAGEERLRIGAQLLAGRCTPEEAGLAHGRLGEAALIRMAEAAAVEMKRTRGEAPGRWAVLGLGKLGGLELSATSDLDLMVVYDAGTESANAPGAWFARFTRRLVAALSAPTEEGGLFEADLALRPSGASGPVAVTLARFRTYYAEEAWTWERMALTRARAIVGDAGLCSELEAEIGHVLAAAGPPEDVFSDAAAMRARLLRDKPARSAWDVKLIDGGLIDVEFIVQAVQLASGIRAGARTPEAISHLERNGALSSNDAAGLLQAWREYNALIQLMKVAFGDVADPASAASGLQARLLEAWKVPDIDLVKKRLIQRAQSVREMRTRILGGL